jgi:hypothetical protein
LSVPFEIYDFEFQKKYIGITALISAFDRAIAQFIGPRVWPSDPFGGGSCTSGYMLKLVANPSSDWEYAAKLCAEADSQAMAVRPMYFTSVLEVHTQGGLCKTFPLSIRIPETARFEDVRYEGSLQ